MKEKIKKIDAAQRQLDSAITLWFQGGDTVATHTLACSAYQIIHDINQNKKGRDLLLDTVVIKDEFRRDFISRIKSSYNFFKHARKDPDPNGIIEFDSSLTELFLLFSIVGLELNGIKSNSTRNAFTFYLTIHKPRIMTEKFRKLLAENIPSEVLQNIRGMERNDFFEHFSLVWREVKNR
jgi:hypothetical protein